MIHFFTESSVASIPLAIETLAQLRSLLSGSTRHDFDDAENPLSEKLLSAVSAKPSATKTLHRASVALFAALAKITKTTGHEVTWLSHEQPDFKVFARQMYTWANSDILPSMLAKSLLRSLFVQLGEETLLFLASVWTRRDEPLAVRIAALRHAGAFVAAHKTQADGIDFQLIMPSLLVALADEDKKVREASVIVVKAISAVHTGSENVYALDSIYGSRSSKWIR